MARTGRSARWAAVAVTVAGLTGGGVEHAAAQRSPSRSLDWPQFRGLTAGAVDDDPRLPARWSTTENVRWTVEIPGLGWSSPIVSGDLVFVTSAVSAGAERAPVPGLYGPGGGVREDPLGGRASLDGARHRRRDGTDAVVCASSRRRCPPS